MADVACFYSGEAIIDWAELAAACELDLERSLYALDELVAENVVVFWRLAANNRLIHCEFDTEEGDLFYGDDSNKPVDCCDEENALNEYLAGEYDYEADLVCPPKGAPPATDLDDPADEVPLNDPNPKRHRIFLKTDYRCFYCITAWVEQVDHMHPRIRGGSNDDANLIGACQPCNVRKKDRTVEEYRAYLAHKNRLPDISHVRFWGEAVN